MIATTQTPPLTLTIRQAASSANVCPRTISSWISSGKLPSVKIVGIRRILHQDLIKLLTPSNEAKAECEVKLEAGTQGPLFDRRFLDGIIGPGEVDRLIATNLIPRVNGKLQRSAFVRLLKKGEALT